MADHKPHPLEIAWAAGVIEAKGSIAKAGYKVRIESVDEHMIKRVHGILGVGRLVNRGKVARTVHDVWLWETVNMDDCRTALLTILPLLGPIATGKAAKLIGDIERNEVWREKFPEKASSAITRPAGAASRRTALRSTQADG